MVFISLSRGAQLRILAARCVVYTVLFLLGSLPLYGQSVHLRVFITAVLTGLCFGIAQLITGYFDRWGWHRLFSGEDWRRVWNEVVAAKDSRAPSIQVSEPEIASSKKGFRERYKIVVDFLRPVIEVLALFAAIYYAHVARNQWIEMRKTTTAAQKTLQHSEESFRVDERAWLEIEPIRGTLFAQASGNFGALFEYPLYLKNVGKTAARDIEFRSPPGFIASVEMGNSAEEVRSVQDKLLLGKYANSSDIPMSNPVSKVLGPFTSAAVPFLAHLQEPHIFSKSEMVSYLIGRIDYTDEFQTKHWLKFCFFVANARGELWNCKEGNDEDR